MEATLPATAWEQAVFVALFVIFCLTLIGGLLSWFTRQQSQWQAFISKRDTDWQSWMDNAELRSAKQIDDVAKILQHISEQLEQHDRQAKEIKGTTERIEDYVKPGQRRRVGDK